MYKLHIFLAIGFSLFMTACAERGQDLKPTINTTMATAISKKSIISEHKVMPKQKIKVKKTFLKKKEKTIVLKAKQSKTMQKKISISPLKQKETKAERDSFFNFDEEIKNKISGFFILIIGIIALL